MEICYRFLTTIFQVRFCWGEGMEFSGWLSRYHFLQYIYLLHNDIINIYQCPHSKTHMMTCVLTKVCSLHPEGSVVHLSSPYLHHHSFQPFLKSPCCALLRPDLHHSYLPEPQLRYGLRRFCSRQLRLTSPEAFFNT